MLVAQGDDQLLVGVLLAVLVQDAHVRLTTVEGLGRLAETAGETIVHQSQLQDALEGVQDGHLALGSIGGNLDLGGDLGGVVFYVRLLARRISCRLSRPPMRPAGHLPRRRMHNASRRATGGRVAAGRHSPF